MKRLFASVKMWGMRQRRGVSPKSIVAGSVPNVGGAPRGVRLVKSGEIFFVQGAIRGPPLVKCVKTQPAVWFC